MKLIAYISALALFATSAIAFNQGEPGFALGLFGGACAWLLLAVKEPDRYS